MNYRTYLPYKKWLKTTTGLVNEMGEMLDRNYEAWTGYGQHLAFFCSRCNKGYLVPWGFYLHCLVTHGIFPKKFVYEIGMAELATKRSLFMRKEVTRMATTKVAKEYNYVCPRCGAVYEGEVLREYTYGISTWKRAGYAVKECPECLLARRQK